MESKMAQFGMLTTTPDYYECLNLSKNPDDASDSLLLQSNLTSNGENSSKKRNSPP